LLRIRTARRQALTPPGACTAVGIGGLVVGLLMLERKLTSLQALASEARERERDDRQRPAPAGK
jgi:hypothetical protein